MKTLLIALDIDHVILQYDKVLHAEAVKRGILSKRTKKSRHAISRILLESGKRDEWRRLLDDVIDSRIKDAVSPPGLKSTASRIVRKLDAQFVLVGQKPLKLKDKKRTKFLDALSKWLEKHQLSDLGVERKRWIYLETKEDRLFERLGKLGATHLVSANISFLEDHRLPSSMERLYFDANVDDPANFPGLRVVRDWKEIGAYFFPRKGSVTRPPAKTSEPWIEELRRQGYSLLGEGRPFHRGISNHLYRVASDSNHKFVVKRYCSDYTASESLRREFLFLSFLNGKGFSNVPAPVYASETEKFLVMTELPGNPGTEYRMTKRILNRVLQFLREINKFRDDPQTRFLPRARGFCSSIGDYFQDMERLISRFKEIPRTTPVRLRLMRFIFSDLIPAWNLTRDWMKLQLEKIKIVDPDETELLLSPGDLGAHNILVNDTGDLCFSDFDDAGWDDPASLICRFITQHRVELTRSHSEYFRNQMIKKLDCESMVKHRVELLLPLFQIRRCGRILERFLLKSTKVPEQILSNRLRLARDYFETRIVPETTRFHRSVLRAREKKQREREGEQKREQRYNQLLDATAEKVRRASSPKGKVSRSSIKSKISARTGKKKKVTTKKTRSVRKKR